MGPRTVLVHGDHHLALRLRAALADAGLHLVAHLTSAVELAEAVVALGPAVLVTAMALDGRDAMPAVSEAVRRLPGLRVVVLTAGADRAGVRAALAAGAHGVLVAGDDAESLGRKVVLVATRGAVIVESLDGGPAAAQLGPLPDQWEPLPSPAAACRPPRVAGRPRPEPEC